VLAASVALALSLVQAPADNAELKSLSDRIDALAKGPNRDWNKIQAEYAKSRQFVREQVAQDRLKTADDFRIAANLADDSRGWSENRMLQHELAATATVMGVRGGPELFRRTWDGLMLSLGRPQRFGFFRRPEKEGSNVYVPFNMDTNRPGASVLLVFEKPDQAIAKARAGKNNAELEDIRKADQADRTGEMTAAKMKGMHERDVARMERTLELLRDGDLTTGRDLHNAALVLQHGDDTGAYAAAHELAVAACILGDTEAKWLVSRTYDRMLLSIGHRQRLGTQFWPGTPEGIAPMNESASNDTIRAALGASTLKQIQEQAKKYAAAG